MAILDQRILPFIETLATSGMDWLAFEVVTGIAQGRQLEESEVALSRARERASDLTKAEESDDGVKVTPEADPILGDEQLKWAVAYVLGRIGDTIDALETSLGHLQDFGGSNDGHLRDVAPVTFVLIDREQTYEATPDHIKIGRDGLEALRVSLTKWIEEHTDGGLKV